MNPPTPCTGKSDVCSNGYLCSEHKYIPVAQKETEEQRIVRMNKDHAVIIEGVIYPPGTVEALGRLTV